MTEVSYPLGEHEIVLKMCRWPCRYHRDGYWRVYIDGRLMGQYRRGLAEVLRQARRAIRRRARP